MHAYIICVYICTLSTHTYLFKHIHVHIPESRGFRLDHSLVNLQLHKRHGRAGVECRPIAFNSGESPGPENVI